MNYFVYIIHGPRGAVYVGKTNNPNRRWYEHRYRKNICNVRLYHAMRKYGAEKFEFEVVFQTVSEEAAYAAERVIFEQERAQGKVMYNLTDCGLGGCSVSEETRIRMSKAHKGVPVPPRSQSWRDKMSANKRHWHSQLPVEPSWRQYGEQTSRAKLTVEQVQEIKRLWFCGMTTQRELAGMFGVNQSSISGIVTGRYWSKAAA